MNTIGVRIDASMDFALEQLAEANKTSKSEIIRDAITKYLNGMYVDHLSAMQQDIASMKNMLSKELYRYNSILAKNTLYSVATRIHLMRFHELTRGHEEAREIADKTWKEAVTKKGKHYHDTGLSSDSKEEKND